MAKTKEKRKFPLFFIKIFFREFTKLQVNNPVVLQQLLEGLPFADDLQFAVRVHGLGGVAAAVVVTAHGSPVGACIMENQKVADLRLRELARYHEAAFFLREHVTGFAKRACHDGIDRFVEFATVAGNDGNTVIAAVETRANKIGKADVEQVEQIIALLLDGADFGHQVTALGHQVAIGFNFQVNLVADALLDVLACLVPQVVVGLHVDAVALVFFVVRNREAAPCTDGAEVRTQAAAGVHHGVANLREVLEVGTGRNSLKTTVMQPKNSFGRAYEIGKVC